MPTFVAPKYNYVKLSALASVRNYEAFALDRSHMRAPIAHSY